ncbi:restriction endonuclease subunit S [Bifidobacterium longum]|uniref:Restriction endonuclease S subunit n=2 Tax=Bifidobacterium longum TaxID=216816 RepID=A0AB38IK24_BIFLL|nr:restriction endonuclease subunit S [Bifidobacterium longum]TCF08883.1 restriction endonuclease S subunit [Bifidobacterium longum subsp. longum]KAB7266463.1 restriction endonuclease subunit S [Bifidobacterium longum]KAB7271300.1 restriction endonuclease subunit S [Bifidobacterium longum]KAB7308275.1 restriction endonuclease subunit S [Bifidobacterium longum]
MTEQAKVPAIRFAGFTDPWEQRKLGELSSEFQSGDFISAEEILGSGPYPVYGGNGLRGYAKQYNHDGFYALIGRQGALCGNVNTAVGKAYFTEHAVAVKANFLHDTRFLAHLLGCMDLGRYSGQSAQPGLAVGVLKEVETTVPSKAEQQAIGSFFSRLDSLITLHQRKYDKLVIFKKSMLEKMFPKDGESVPEIRFAGFTDPWEQRKLGEIADKVTEKNLDGNITEVLTNSAEYGVINQTEFFDHAVAKESNIAGYYVIAPGDFVYNPRISATAPVGPIRRNTLGIHGVMSPLYTVFRLTDAVDGTYLSHFFKTNGWHGFMKLEGNSGARSDRFSIGDATFFEMPIPVPSSSEQHAIGSFFSRLDDLITLHQRKLELLQNIKKSLLDKMFV